MESTVYTTESIQTYQGLLVAPYKECKVQDRIITNLYYFKHLKSVANIHKTFETWQF